MSNFEIKFYNKILRKKDYTVPFHVHSCNEIVIYMSGNGKTVIDNKEYAIKKNRIAYIKKGVPHSEDHLEDYNIIFFGFEDTDNLLHIESGVYDIESSFEKFITLAEFISKEMKSQNNLYKLVISSTIMTFLIFLKREIKDGERKPKTLEYCANYLRENCTQPIDTKKLAKDYGYSYDTFRHIFKKEYGMAPHEYIISARLSNAYSLLYETEMTCTDIAMQCGFSDSSQFSKMFKNKFGISPKKFSQSKKQKVTHQ